MGPRRVGKTVMVMQSISEIIHRDSIDNKKILFLSLETPIYTGIGLEKLLNIFQQFINNDNFFIKSKVYINNSILYKILLKIIP